MIQYNIIWYYIVYANLPSPHRAVQRAPLVLTPAQRSPLSRRSGYSSLLCKVPVQYESQLTILSQNERSKSGVKSTQLPTSPTTVCKWRGQTPRHFTPEVASAWINRSAYQNGNRRTLAPHLRPQELLALRLWCLWLRESCCLVYGFSSSFLGLLSTNLNSSEPIPHVLIQPVTELIRQLASFVELHSPA